MAKLSKTVCLYCRKHYLTELEAVECRKSHDDVVILGMLKEDLNRLANYIMTGDRSILTERVSNIILERFRR